VRFADKESHQIFLEPEGRNTPELYVQVRHIADQIAKLDQKETGYS
jgi:tRNA U34 5-carboxymethylaminomethyl modifying enzyme MnmG/GidA